jgi:hypothetical protein
VQAASAHQFRKLGIVIVVAGEFLSFQQRLDLAHAPLGGKTRRECRRWLDVRGRGRT